MRRVRAFVLERDVVCVYCGAAPDGVDHLVPRSAGGSNRPDNLVAACAPCNSRRRSGPVPPMPFANRNTGKKR